MTDVHTTATRSYNMSRVKGKDTKPEKVSSLQSAVFCPARKYFYMLMICSDLFYYF
ncbi:MAG: hypothetical protein ACERKD_22895 [Prolixibacteraceae bacterium]